MIKLKENRAEAMLHRVNGYLTIFAYIFVAVLAMSHGTSILLILAWIVGLAIHLLKLVLVKRGLAVRYGGYLGALLLITWVIVIFTHLPTDMF